MDAAYDEGDREKCGEFDSEFDVRSVARFVNEDASMRSRNRSPLIQWRMMILLNNRFSPGAVGARCGKISLVYE